MFRLLQLHSSVHFNIFFNYKEKVSEEIDGALVISFMMHTIQLQNY
jgi:hypothetical protein